MEAGLSAEAGLTGRLTLCDSFHQALPVLTWPRPQGFLCWGCWAQCDLLLRVSQLRSRVPGSAAIPCMALAGPSGVTLLARAGCLLLPLACLSPGGHLGSGEGRCSLCPQPWPRVLATLFLGLTAFEGRVRPGEVAGVPLLLTEHSVPRRRRRSAWFCCHLPSSRRAPSLGRRFWRILQKFP